MTEGDKLLHVLLDDVDVGDDDLKLIYADWLEENVSHQHAQYIRLIVPFRWEQSSASDAFYPQGPRIDFKNPYVDKTAVARILNYGSVFQPVLVFKNHVDHVPGRSAMLATVKKRLLTRVFVHQDMRCLCRRFRDLSHILMKASFELERKFDT